MLGTSASNSAQTPSAARPPRLALRFALYTGVAGHYTPLGAVTLPAGPHAVSLRHERSRLRPGEHGEAWSFAPLLVTPAERCS